MKAIKNKTLIILLGGKGTRFSDLKSSPKQLLQLNKHNILMNIILNYKKFKINNFILPLGHKSEYFKKYFNKKILKKYKINLLNKDKFNIKPNLLNLFMFNAGKNSTKIQRILKSTKFINYKYFFVTYGDGVADINLSRVENIFIKKKLNSILCVKKINSNFGHLNIKNNYVKKFEEKPLLQNPINIGYYMFDKEFFKSQAPNFKSLEINFLPHLANKKILISHEHKGFFFKFDSKNDLINFKTKGKNFFKYL